MRKNRYQDRRRVRHFLNRLLCVSLILLYVIFLQTVGVLLGFLNKNTVLTALNESTYYENLYDELRQDTEMYLGIVGIPLSVMEGAVTYENVRIAGKQQIENDLAGGDYQTDTGILINKLEQNLSQYFEDSSITLTGLAKQGVEQILGRLEDKFSDLLVFPFVTSFITWRQQWMQSIKQMAWIAVPLFFGVELLLYFIQHYPKKAVRYNAYALGTAGFITIGSAVAYGIKSLYSNTAAHEASIRFLQEYLARSLQVFLYIGLLAILLAAVLYGITRHVNMPRSASRS